MKPNLERRYAHEVVTAAMHNEVCNLSVAERARDQAEIIREQRDNLASALRALSNSCDAGLGTLKAPDWGIACHAAAVLAGDCHADFAALAKIR